MPANMPLDVLPLWALFFLTVLLILLAEELGFRLGRVRARRTNRESDAPVGGMVGAELGLLAFLLAFTFGIATSRFDSRRTVLLDESNAVGTAYLRAAMLPEPHRAQVREFLREYVDVRIAAAQGESSDHAIRRSEALHGRLWTEAVAVAEKDPRSVPIGLFVESINEVIDLHALRVTAGLRSRIPTVVWAVLFTVAVLSFATMGYQGGLTGIRRSPAVLVIAVTFAIVIWLVADLDRPGQGALRVSQQPMIELRNSMK
jgi:hypothetical protein